MSQPASRGRAALAAGLVSLLVALGALWTGDAVARSRATRPGHSHALRERPCPTPKRKSRARKSRCRARATKAAKPPAVATAPAGVAGFVPGPASPTTQTNQTNQTNQATQTTPATPAAPAAPATQPNQTNQTTLLTPPLQSGPPQLPVNVPSAWDEPVLDDPTTIQVTSTNSNLVLDQNQDYVLQCPAGPLELTAPLNVWGGHNVVLQDCDIEQTEANWAGRFSDQTGTLWIHDVHFGGSDLSGGVQLQEPGATVVMRDVLFDRVYGSQSTNHAELIQTWSGPSRLMIDGLTGATTYQGLFLLPDQYDSGPPPAVFDFRHIDIDDTEGANAMWLGDVADAAPNDMSGSILTWNVQDVYVLPNPARSWPGWWLEPQPSTGDPTWDNALAGTPPGGSYVQATAAGATGVDEGVSPTPLVGEEP